MSTGVVDPPVYTGNDKFFSQEDNVSSIHFYLDYEYLPLKQISSLIKDVNGLYELVYSILYNEKVPKDDCLVLTYAATTNSLEWIAGLLKVLNPSKRARKALLIIGLIIGAPFVAEEYMDARALRKINDAKVQKIIAETRSINADAENKELQNRMLKRKIEQDSIDKIIQPDNLKRINNKTVVIRKTIVKNTVNIFAVNSDVVYRKDDK